MNAKKKKFSYLSMCSCCSVVSKYSVNVKRHLQKEHGSEKWRKEAKTVIPVRVSSRYEKCIHRSLDRAVYLKELKSSSRVRSSFNEENTSHGSTKATGTAWFQPEVKKLILCNICMKYFVTFEQYSSHLSAPDHDHIRVDFSCPECVEKFPDFKALESHYQQKHPNKTGNLSPVACIHISFVEKRQDSLDKSSVLCPYCQISFSGVELDRHIKDSHFDNIDILEMKQEVGLEGEVTRSVFVIYKCPHCLVDFHSIIEIINHVSRVHADVKKDIGRFGRKRKAPKWLEDEEYTVKGSKKKNIESKRTVERRGRPSPNFKGKLKQAEKINHTETKMCESSVKRGRGRPPKKKLHQQASAEKEETTMLAGNSASEVRNSVGKLCMPVKVKLQRLPVNKEAEMAKKAENVNINTKDREEARKKETLTSDQASTVEAEEVDELDEFDEADLHDSDDDYIPEEEEDDKENEGDFDIVKQDKERYACKFCEKSYIIFKSLQRHLKEKHTPGIERGKKANVSKARSPRVEKRTDEVKLEPGQRKVSKFVCPYCHFYLFHKEYIVSHIQLAHPEIKNFTRHDIVTEEIAIDKDVDREFFKCPQCSHEEKWKKDLVNHMASCIGNGARSQIIPCLLPESYTMKRLLTASLVCPICKTVKNGKEELEKHMKEDHLQDQGCSVQLRSSLPEPQPIVKKCREHFCFICPSCHFSTRRRDMLRDHMRIHKYNQGISMPLIKCDLLGEESVEGAANEVKDTSVSDEGSGVGTEQNDEKLVGKLGEGGIKKATKTQKGASGVQDGTQTVENEPGEQSNVQLYTADETRLKEGTYICPICEDFTTTVKEECVEHYVNRHFDRTNEYDIHYIQPDIVLREDVTNKTRGQLICKVCDKTEPNFWNLVKHANLSKGHQSFKGSSKIKHLRVAPITVENAENGTEDDDGNPFFEVVTKPGTGIEYIAEKETVVGEYKCYHCDAFSSYITKKGLMRHIKSQHPNKYLQDAYTIIYQMRDVIAGGGEKSFTCKLCEEKFVTDRELEKHFSANHKPQLPEVKAKVKEMKEALECNVCYKVLNKKMGLHRHLLMHMNQWQPHCPLCVLAFDTQEEADHHAAVCHPDKAKICEVCAKTFMSNKAYQSHMKHHETDGSTDPENPESSRRLCQHCGANVSKNSIKRHILRYHWMHVTCECDICKTQKEVPGKTVLRCGECPTIVCSRYALDAHCWKHHPEKHKRKFKTCSKCKRPMHGFDSDIICACNLEEKAAEIKLTKKESHKLERIASHGNFEEIPQLYHRRDLVEDCSTEAIKRNIMKVDAHATRPYICSVCGFAAKKKKDLYRHVRRKHMKDEAKPYGCNRCQMRFSSMAELRRHCRSHLNMKPFQCKICKDKFFKSRSHLKEHLYTHMSTFKFTCGYCDRKFAQSGPMYCHALCHDRQKPFKCVFCEASFSSSSELMRHMEKYQQDETKNKLTCSYCNQQFPNMHYLTKHVLLHFPQDPFQCFVCEARFSTFHRLFSHKSAKRHFTEEEREMAKQDMSNPGRRFRQYSSRLKPSSQEVTTEEVLLLSSPAKQDSEVVVATGRAEAELPEVPEVVEIEISEDIANTIGTKEGISLFEDQIIKGMFDIGSKDNVVSISGPSTSYHYVTQQGNAEEEVEQVAVLEGDNVYAGNETVVGEVDPNAGYIASILAQNEPGKTQTFQMPDGSLIHVFVQKPVAK